MNLTFENFKQSIPSHILTRGRNYFRQGHILDLTFDKYDMLWEAQIEGTELYDVRIEQTTNGDLICSCTCPYDMGKYCKHVAAILYAIEDTFPEQLNTKPKRRSSKRQNRHDKLRQQLEKISREHLITVLLDLTRQDRELLNQLLIRFDTGNAKPMDYRRVVKDALRVGRGEYGYLDYSGSNRAGRKIEQLLDQAQQWIAANDVKKAVGLYQSIIDEVVSVIPQADDSNGALGDCISLAIEGLNEAADLLDKDGQESLFTFYLERARQQKFRSWDWGWELLSIASEMVHDSVQRTQFESILKDIEEEVQKSSGSEFYSQYELEQVALFRLSLIERFDDSISTWEFLKSHVHLDRLRIILIKRSISEGKLDEATRLIQSGIISSEERRLPGLTNQYRTLQLTLLQAHGNKSALLDATRALWLDRGDEETFTMLKQVVPDTEWPGFVDNLIKDIQHIPVQVAWLYAHENRWKELMTLVESNLRSEWLIEAYRDPLESHFPSRVANIYEKTVELIVAHASGRKQYKQAIIYLHRIKELGQSGRVEGIVSRLRSQYSRRTALLDELSRL